MASKRLRVGEENGGLGPAGAGGGGDGADTGPGPGAGAGHGPGPSLGPGLGLGPGPSPGLGLGLGLGAGMSEMPGAGAAAASAAMAQAQMMQRRGMLQRQLQQGLLMPLLSTEDVGGMELEGAGGGGDDGGDYEDDEGAFLDGDFLMGGRRRDGRRVMRRSSAPYSLHPSEHMEMTSSGLPAVSAAALARVKGRSRAPKPKLSVALRRGKWSQEEEDFTHIIVDTFKEGVLPLADGTTLRTYVSGQLHCAPMRITKKCDIARASA